jgi:sulfite dehydrogenase (cytochrome) subunit B
MTILARALIVVFLALAAGAAAAEEIALPPDHAYGILKPGEGSDVTARNCVICHSGDYIVMQPHGDQKQWDGVVTKMIKVFGAPVSDADARIIAEYLARQYGK